MGTTLDLIGVISLLAGDIAKGSLRYANADWKRALTSFFVIPGLYNVSTQMMKRSNSRVALLLSPGDREDRRIMVGFKSKYAYQYVGVTSGTNAVVANATFEAWLNRKTEYTHINDALYFRHNTELGTATTIGQVECTADTHKTGSIIHISGPWYTVSSIVLQILSLTILVLMMLERDIACIILTTMNMVANFLIVCAITCDEFSTPDATPAANVGSGNMVVTNMSNNNIWAVNGKESVIQNIAQREVRIHDSKLRDFLETIAATIGYGTTVATILVTPVMSQRSKMYFAIQMLVGLLANMLFSSRDGDILLERTFEKYYNMANLKMTRFTNRASAVAAAQLFTMGNSENIRSTVVPCVGPWVHYRQALDELTSMSGVKKQAMYEYFTQNVHPSKVEAAQKIAHYIPQAGRLMPNELNEANLDRWPHRLVIDIAEAFIHTANTPGRDLISDQQ